jgi:hypothetical protein
MSAIALTLGSPEFAGTTLRNGTLATLFSLHHPRKRVIQYFEGAVIELRSRGVLDTPLEPVIGLAAGETRWRGMTVRGLTPSGQMVVGHPRHPPLPTACPKS